MEAVRLLQGPVLRANGKRGKGARVGLVEAVGGVDAAVEAVEAAEAAEAVEAVGEAVGAVGAVGIGVGASEETSARSSSNNSNNSNDAQRMMARHQPLLTSKRLSRPQQPSRPRRSAGKPRRSAGRLRPRLRRNGGPRNGGETPSHVLRTSRPRSSGRGWFASQTFAQTGSACRCRLR